MIDFPFQTYLFIYSLCTTPEFSEKQNKHYLKFCCSLFFVFFLCFFSLWKENLTGKSYCCVSCFVWHTFIYPKACFILLLLWKLVISIKVAFLYRGLISVDQSYWLIANSPLPSSIYILGAKRLGGETTRGEMVWGRNVPDSNPNNPLFSASKVYEWPYFFSLVYEWSPFSCRSISIASNLLGFIFISKLLGLSDLESIYKLKFEWDLHVHGIGWQLLTESLQAGCWD